MLGRVKRGSPVREGRKLVANVRGRRIKAGACAWMFGSCAVSLGRSQQCEHVRRARSGEPVASGGARLCKSAGRSGSCAAAWTVCS